MTLINNDMLVPMLDSEHSLTHVMEKLFGAISGCDPETFLSYALDEIERRVTFVRDGLIRHAVDVATPGIPSISASFFCKDCERIPQANAPRWSNETRGCTWINSGASSMS